MSAGTLPAALQPAQDRVGAWLREILLPDVRDVRLRTKLLDDPVLWPTLEPLACAAAGIDPATPPGAGDDADALATLLEDQDRWFLMIGVACSADCVARALSMPAGRPLLDALPRESLRRALAAGRSRSGVGAIQACDVATLRHRGLSAVAAWLAELPSALAARARFQLPALPDPATPEEALIARDLLKPARTDAAVP